ncbi:MAG: site-specific integrase [Proteobacteria bacterium]|nr:site-specific integrase [Pseudomonadota bacterium]
MKRIKTKNTGVYSRKSDVRKHNKKPDVCYDVVYRNQGKLVWEKIGWLSEGITEKLAVQIRGERIRALRFGETLPKQKAKIKYFKDVAETYKTWARENKASWVSDFSRLKKHLIPALGKLRLDEITSFRLEKLKSDLTHKKLAPGTVKGCLVLFRTIFNKSVAWGLHAGANPIKGIKLPSVQNQRERFLSYDEAKMLLEALKARSETLYDMATVSLHCGLRAGEIFSLKGQHIDLENGLITVADAKNKQSRKAFMTNTVKDILKNRMTEKENYIFVHHGKHKIKVVPESYREVVQELGFNKGIEDRRQKVCFHTLRHTFASWLALQGESLMTIRELLGHMSFGMTQKYAHLIPDEKRKATLRLEQAFNKKAVKTEKVEG